MKITSLFFFLLLSSLTSFAQEEQQFEFDYTIQSAAFGDERKITVYLPPSFYDYPEDKFIVSYVLDGHFDPFIDLGVKILEYNSYMYKYTPTIVVGIHAKSRGREFSAPKPSDENQTGRAPALQEHFKSEVFPLVDSLYKDRVHPFRNLIGHSAGGVFVLNTLFSDQKDMFNAYMAISPGVRKHAEYVMDNIATELKAGKQFNKFLYCSSGTVGEREELFGGAVHRLDSMLQLYPDHGLIWKKSKFEGMGHWTCVPPSFNDGMVELTRALRVDEKMFFDYANHESKSMTEQIESFYDGRKEKYGFVEIPPGGYLTRVAWELMDKNKKPKALEVFDWGVQQHPEHYTLNKSRARLLAQMGKTEAARAAYDRSLELLELVKGKMSEEDYLEDLEILKRRRAELE